MSNNIIHKEGSLRNNRGLRIYYQSWSPETNHRANFLLAHGVGEHSGRYRFVVDYFVPKGVAIFALDHQGHGKSEGKRGCVGQFTDFSADLHQLRENVQEQMADKPTFLLGHSMGGLIALHYLLDHSHGLTGAIFSSPAFAIAVQVPMWKEMLARLLIKAKLDVTMPSGIAPEQLTHDLAVVRVTKQDALFHDRVSAALYYGMLDTIAECNRRAAEIRLPLLLLLGAEDRVCSAEGAKLLMEKFASKDKVVLTFPNAYHEVFNEINRVLVFEAVWKWLASRLTIENQ